MDQALESEHAYVRRDAKATSVLAALVTLPRSRTRRYAVLEAIAGAGEHGRTDEELYGLIGAGPNTVRPRRVELVDGRWIEDSGKRRPTCTGADAIVWVLTEEGAAKWRARP
jgi:hypothetical protein